MSDGGDQRRLSAILVADVVGYTRRMEEDTEGTVAAWKAARADIIDPTIAEHSGRIVKHTGDGFLAKPFLPRLPPYRGQGGGLLPIDWQGVLWIGEFGLYTSIRNLLGYYVPQHSPLASKALRLRPKTLRV